MIYDKFKRTKKRKKAIQSSREGNKELKKLKMCLLNI
jgi:hypothetical protein